MVAEIHTFDRWRARGTGEHDGNQSCGVGLEREMREVKE